ncbi:MAG: DNA mismatch endonuclease Vsr [Pseudomonadota bacterium]
MADTVDRATRSRIMRAIKSKGTGPELRLAVALRLAKAPRFTDGDGLPGSPDFVFPKHRLAVFCNGCFWHLCRKHYKPVDPARSDWAKKMDRNRRRDVRVRRQLRRLGWATLVVWEHETPKAGALRVVRRLAAITLWSTRASA